MLSRRLKELECHGFVDRSVEETTPPTTSYRLTTRGTEFARSLRESEGLVDVARCEGRDACRNEIGEGCVSVATDGGRSSR